MARRKALVGADRWLHWSISSARYSRIDSTIPFDFHQSAVPGNEIVP